jgi:hypothetical protein
MDFHVPDTDRLWTWMRVPTSGTDGHAQLVPLGVVKGGDDRPQERHVTAGPGIFHAAPDYFSATALSRIIVTSSSSGSCRYM